MSIRGVGLLALAFAFSGDAAAATISIRPFLSSDRGEQPDGIQLTGPIEAGDLLKLELVLESYNYEYLTEPDTKAILHLDSPGGNFSEGLEIAQLVRERNIGTKIGRGANCYSACAIIFMHGTGSFEGRQVLYRELDTGGRLGFHAPYLVLGEGFVSSPEMVGESYAMALDQIATLLASGADVMSPDLVQEMLRFGPEEVLMIDTTGESLAWNLPVDRYRDIVSAKFSQLIMLCQIAYDVHESRRTTMTMEEARALAEASPPTVVATLRDDTAVYDVGGFNRHDSWGTDCFVGVKKNKNETLSLTYSFDRVTGDWWPASYYLADWRFIEDPRTSFLE